MGDLWASLVELRNKNGLRMVEGGKGLTMGGSSALLHIYVNKSGPQFDLVSRFE